MRLRAVPFAPFGKDPNSIRRLKKRLLIFSLFLIGLAAVFLSVSGCGTKQTSPPQARFVKQVPWTGKGSWLKADTHVHTKFSDGSHTIEEVVDRALQFGCNVLAITDHADRNLKAATKEYHEAIHVERRRHPDLILLAGLEWNLPPWGGDEHATILIHPDLEEWSVLARFKDQFDDLDRKPHRAELADEALRWLDQHAVHGEVRPVVIYEHPSRRRDRSLDIVPILTHWRQINDVVIGFSGAPGHQRYKTIGAFRKKEKAIDRWDPAAARVGDAWDTLLAQGLDLWAADAPSDFHNENPNDLHDYWPGEFAEIWLYVPEKTAAGVLQSFHAGTFFAAHGHIVREVELTVEAAGLPRRAGVGEVIELPQGSTLSIQLRCTVPAMDWEGKANRLDEIEVIGIQRGSTRIVATLKPTKGGEVPPTTLEVPAGGIVIRARGRRNTTNGGNLMFYTNSIRISDGT
jgi:hypothetical protein